MKAAGTKNNMNTCPTKLMRKIKTLSTNDGRKLNGGYYIKANTC